jgi:hypothetical protein
VSRPLNWLHCCFPSTIQSSVLPCVSMGCVCRCCTATARFPQDACTLSLASGTPLSSLVNATLVRLVFGFDGCASVCLTLEFGTLRPLRPPLQVPLLCVLDLSCGGGCEEPSAYRPGDSAPDHHRGLHRQPHRTRRLSVRAVALRAGVWQQRQWSI